MEECFPRGGTLASATKRKAFKTEKDLFKTSSDEPTKKKKKKTLLSKQEHEKKVLARGKREQAAAQAYSGAATEPTLLIKKDFTVGILVVGCVREVKDFEVVVCLPNGTCAILPITNICDAYSGILHQLTSGEQDDVEDVPALSDLFHPGQLLRCKVVGKEMKGKRAMFTLSVNPRDVNQALHTGIIHSGLVLTGCVSSREDHGYVIDLGVPGSSCFLPNKKAEAFTKHHNDGNPLSVGSYLHCMVTDKPRGSEDVTRALTITINTKKIHGAVVTDSMGITLDTLLPGMVLNATVTKTTGEGIVVKLLSHKGRIHRSHLLHAPSHYNITDKVKVAVLHFDSTLKIVTLTELSHLVSPEPSASHMFGDHRRGDIIEEATIWNINKLYGVYFSLGKGIRALARTLNLSDQVVKDFSTKFKKGEKHRCRVIGFDYNDGVVLISLKKSVLNQTYLSLSDINLADTVTVKVQKFLDHGVSVRLPGGVFGYIPSEHLSDVPLRHPEKKFKVDQEIQCKVLKVNPEEKKLHLTCKKSLLTSKYPSLVSYDQCCQGLFSEGTVFKIMKKGLVIRFYGEVQGFLPRQECNLSESDQTHEVFYVGQVLRCVIKRWQPEKRGILLSLKISDKATSARKNLPVPDDFEIGELVDCEVKRRKEAGLEVTLFPSKMAAFLPTMHLSDQHDNCEMLLTMYEKGDIMKRVMYFDKRDEIILTKKTCLIQGYRDHTAVSKFDDLQPGMLLPGVISTKMEYGVFVNFAPHLKGLCPNRYLVDQKVSTPSSLYKEGQSVIAKVVEVDADKRRFLVSVRMSDCYHGNIEDGVDLVTSYLHEYHLIVDKLKAKTGRDSGLWKFVIGEVIPVTVTQVTEKGVLCRHSDGIQGVVTLDNMPGVSVSEGDSVDGVILHIDPETSCLELSFNDELVKSIKHLHDNKFTKVKDSQVLKSEVHLVKEHFTLVALKGHATGRLAYLPARKHLNDVMERHLFVVGQVNPIVIKRVEEDRIVACLESHDKEAQEMNTPGNSSTKSTKVSIKEGDVITARVVSIQDLQMSIEVGGMKGRVHITEVTDHPKQGECPLKKYEVGENVKVKVLAFREWNIKKKKVPTATLR